MKRFTVNAATVIGVIIVLAIIAGLVNFLVNL